MNDLPTTSSEPGAPARPLLRAYLFDRLRLAHGDVEVTPAPGSQQARLIASLLLAHGRPLSANALIERLWPEEAEDMPAQGDDWPQRALGRLHKLASGARALLAPVAEPAGVSLRMAGGRLALEPAAAIWSDALALLRAYDESQAALARGDLAGANAAFRRGVALYAGELLADEHEAGWILRPRGDLRVKALLMLAGLADDALASNRPAEAVHWAGLGLQHDWAAEELYHALIRGLARLGRRTLALRSYERCREALAELGMAPGATTEQLAAALRRDETV